MPVTSSLCKFSVNGKTVATILGSVSKFSLPFINVPPFLTVTLPLDIKYNELPTVPSLTIISSSDLNFHD